MVCLVKLMVKLYAKSVRVWGYENVHEGVQFPAEISRVRWENKTKSPKFQA